jgi:amino acid adenylation domain-containing protein
MADDAQLRLILTDEESRAVVPSTDAEMVLVAQAGANQPATLPPPLASGDHLAYVLYTSGSTGKPKGVQIPRRAFTNFIRAMQQQPGLTEHDVLLAVTTLSFDISGLELFLPLSVGARVVIATRDQASDGQELQDLLASTGATIMQATPATWRLLIDAGWNGAPTLSILCGGEALPTELAAQLLERCGALWNMYGPTETTVWSTMDRVTTSDRITVGRPIGNTKIHIVDEQLRPVPAGLRGEICIAGDGVARGYLNRVELTAEKFVRDSFSTVAGDRMYRTGDLGRWLPDGRLDVLGRADQQVKLRGFRIELGEIEAVLERHDAIRQAVATVFDDGLGDRRLVAYVVHAPGVDATASELRRFLRQDLPDYMVPSLFIPLDALPLTPNGKVDRKALPAPLGQQRRRNEVVAPRTEMEQRIAALWTEAIGARDVSVFDNFFDIGGHSLLSLQVIARIEQQIGVRLNPARFVMDSLEQIAAACEQLQKARRSA